MMTMGSQSEWQLTLGIWLLADCSKKPGSAAFTASVHWALAEKIFARVASIGIEL